MAEKNLIVNNMILEYKGIFILEELIAFIDKLVQKHGYKNHLKQQNENVKADHKEFYMELFPGKKKNAYQSVSMKIFIEAKNMKEQTFNVDDIPTVFQEAELSFSFNGWVVTDLKNRWGMKPFVWFLKAIFHKYVYQFPLTDAPAGEISGDVHEIYNQVKAHLNLYKFRVKK